jgi:YD repeat-containing protein
LSWDLILHAGPRSFRFKRKYRSRSTDFFPDWEVVMKKPVFVLLIFVLAQCAWCKGARAQHSGPCWSGFDVAAVNGMPEGYYCIDYSGVPNGHSWCTYRNSSCAPAAAAGETGCAGCGKGQPVASSPISLANGNTYIEQNDIRIPGLGNGLILVRTWNSRWPSTQMASQVGSFGPNWRSTYEERVFLGDDGYVRYARSDGSFWSFAIGGPGGWVIVAPANGGVTLVQGTNYWTLTLKSGEQRRFDLNSGSLTTIIDRNGSTTQLTYDGLNRLVTVTDPASRTLTFTYASNTSFLVTGVSSSVGISLAYTYDSQNRLSQVTKPDQTTLNFQYDSNSMITAVLDSNGKVLESHTYDTMQRGLTGSKANGIEALTISYH